MSLTSLKDLFDIIQALTVSLVALGGGILYLYRRQRFPRARISHAIFHRRLDAERVLLLVMVTIENCGEVLIRIEEGFARVCNIIPGAVAVLREHAESTQKGEKSNCEASDDDMFRQHAEIAARCGAGYAIGEKLLDVPSGLVEIEPGEEEEFSFHFIIASTLETVSVYSHLGNHKKKKRGRLGWNRTTWYDIKPTGERANEG